MTDPALPQFALRLSGGLDPRRCVTLARAAENAGFASIWFAENPFQRGILATAGACAAATRRVRIGLGVINPYTRHPVQIAMDAAALDELSEGRVTLGIGSGIAPPIGRMGVVNDRPVTAVREAIAIVRALLAGESVAGARLGFAARVLPIYMAAAGEPMLRACGELADGLVVSNLTPPRTTERLIAIVRGAAERARRPRPRIVQYVPCAVRSDAAAARRAVKATLGEMLTNFWPIGDEWPAAKERIVAETGIPRADFASALARLRQNGRAEDVLDDRFVAVFALAGTAADCLHQARAYRMAGVDELALTFAGDEPAEDIACLGQAALC